MDDPIRPFDVTGLTVAGLEQAQRDLRTSLALIRLGSMARVPILAHLRAIDAELADRGEVPS